MAPPQSAYRGDDTLSVSIVTMGDEVSAAIYEGLLDEFKASARTETKARVNKHFVRPARRSGLIKKSLRSKYYKSGGLGKRYPAGKFFPRVYHNTKLNSKGLGPRGTVPVSYNKRLPTHKKAKRRVSYRFLSHRKRLFQSIRATTHRDNPWNLVKVRYGAKDSGIPHAFWYIQRYGDFRPAMVRRFAGDYARSMEGVFESILKVQTERYRKLGVKAGLRAANPVLLKSKLARQALKVENRTRAVRREIKRTQDPGVASQERNMGSRKRSRGKSWLQRDKERIARNERIAAEIDKALGIT